MTAQDVRAETGQREPEPGGTGWFVYGVTGAEASLPADLTGIDEAPVTTLAVGDVAAIVTRVAVERPPGRGVDLLAYNSVLDALAHGDEPVVPVLFGAILPDEQAVLEEFLAPDADHFAEVLESVRGRDQFLFQADYDEQQILGEVVAAEPEIAALRERTRNLPEDAGYGERVLLGERVAGAVERRRAVDADRLLEEVLPLGEAHVLRPVSGLERVVDVALLVARERREDFEARLEELAAAEHGRLRLRLMGPLAPYDFTGGI
jgi:hypothetical protein